MTTVRIYFTGDRVGPRFARGTQRQGAIIRTAIRGAAQDAADLMLKEGQDDIRAASPAFAVSNRWASGLHIPVTEGGGNIRVAIEHDQLKTGFRVHQFGATIFGKPLLWIPLSFANLPKGMSARTYPGRLFRVNRLGKNPLLFASTGKGSKAEPKFVGLKQVTIPKRFHVVEIAREVAGQIGAFYSKRLKSGG